MKIFFRLLRESLIFALHELKANKVRTILSLSGITIGIFSVISVLTIFDSLEIQLRSSINSLGSDVLYIQKWPWSMDNNYPWWKYINRPNTTLTEMNQLVERCPAAGPAAYLLGTSSNIKYKSKSLEDVSVLACSHEYYKLRAMEFARGRYFSPVESQNGRPVIVLGGSLAEKLFKDEEAIGKTIKVLGRKVEVIGILKKEGSAIGESLDDQAVMPVNFARNMLDFDRDGTIVVMPREGVTRAELKDELTGVMRGIRRLSPGAEDNFAINEISIITEMFDGFFKALAIIGWVIGGFSLLVGGFGIANIMFVSVRERTSIIGIQKALGAKNYFVLTQFLTESVVLALMGGLGGLIIIWLLTLLITYGFDFELFLTIKNTILGLSVSAFIGLVSGLIPAWSASKLDPVEAMRSNG
ncbi:MAG TPA: ABC transporter [Bacteroidales bacterium]|nr:MAG: ABC transporter [Bacteroidetes bacterium GWE2_42_24]OFY27549.1 MAG: ABC transporter [Bacteroidetes bacterium GWF2_43_11]PKP27400.1 MAG: ABC transporter [Bacteroidetes bacterium HGW-Bacteroidetes-22]HAQ64970.1 ABC transporter [Bacteroidales bacterium]HBZ66073.1 ABC transporter [Bacteroidales bacterium]